MHAHVTAKCEIGLVPVNGDHIDLHLRHEAEVGQFRRRRRHRTLEERLEVPRHTLYGRLVEQRRVVLQRTAQCVTPPTANTRPVRENERQIELTMLQSHIHRLQIKPLPRPPLLPLLVASQRHLCPLCAHEEQRRLVGTSPQRLGGLPDKADVKERGPARVTPV